MNMDDIFSQFGDIFGGAFGGRSGFGGGGGGYATGSYAVSAGQVLTVIVGEGGGALDRCRIESLNRVEASDDRAGLGFQTEHEGLGADVADACGVVSRRDRSLDEGDVVVVEQFLGEVAVRDERRAAFQNLGLAFVAASRLQEADSVHCRESDGVRPLVVAEHAGRDQRDDGFSWSLLQV